MFAKRMSRVGIVLLLALLLLFVLLVQTAHSIKLPEAGGLAVSYHGNEGVLLKLLHPGMAFVMTLVVTSLFLLVAKVTSK